MASASWSGGLGLGVLEQPGACSHARLQGVLSPVLVNLQICGQGVEEASQIGSLG